MPAEKHIKRLLSYFGLEVMKEDEDGIVPLSDMFLGTRKEPGMATRVITKLIDEFGEDNLDRIETELTKVLKMSIEEWFAKHFIEFHTTLYRLRPVYNFWIEFPGSDCSRRDFKTCEAEM